jgi:molybdopterin synthase catalytic subunit
VPACSTTALSAACAVAYKNLAAVVLPQELCQQACRQWQLCKIAVAHRSGAVLVGEASVIIAVSSAHRREALEVGGKACSSVGPPPLL